MQLGEDTTGPCRGVGVEPGPCWVTVPDDALEPVLAAGEPVIVDRGDQALVGGGIYAVSEGGSLELCLFVPGFAGIGCRLGQQAIGTLTWLSGAIRWRPPVVLDRLQLIGRVVEPAAGALATLAHQQRLLAALREATRAQLLDLAGLPPARPTGATVEAIGLGLAAALADPAAAARLAREQRLDAIDARLALLDELIADLPADGLADALVKLETLGALQPPGARELEPRLLGSALEALRRCAGVALSTPAEPSARPLALVASPPASSQATAIAGEGRPPATASRACRS